MSEKTRSGLVHREMFEQVKQERDRYREALRTIRDELASSDIASLAGRAHCTAATALADPSGGA